MSMNVNLKSTVGGIFESIQIIRPDGSIRHELGPFPNLITDDGLDMIGELSNWQSHLKLGTGTTPPAFTDTELENQVAEASNSLSPSANRFSEPPYGIYSDVVWTTDPFPTSQILGELGVGNSNRLFSRTLIKDSEGDPTTIEVLEGEMVRVNYSCIYYAPANDTTGATSMDIEGVPTEVEWIARGSNVVSNTNPTWSFTSGDMTVGGTGSGRHRVYAGDIGPVTGSPEGDWSYVSSPSIENETYESGTHMCRATMAMGPFSANLSSGPIRSIRFKFGVGVYQLQFDPPIPKDNTKTLVLELSHSWGRAE